MLNIKKIKKIIEFYFPNLIKVELIRHFHFLYGYLRFKPISATINITDRCCFKCIMCNQWREKSKQELGTKDWQVILDQLKEENIKMVTFSGGEPLLRNDLIDIIKYAKKLNMTCSLFTNGYLLNEDNIQKLISSGIDFISISFDGVDDKFNAIRGINGAYEKVKKSAEILANLYKRNMLKVSMSFVLMKPTLNYLNEVLKLRDIFDFPLVINLVDFTPYFFKSIKDKDTLWINEKDMESLSINLKLLAEHKRKKNDSIYLTYSGINYIKNYFIDPLQSRIPCFVSQERICIDPEGNVYGGCWSMGSFGNLRENSLKHIIHSIKYKNAHRDMFFKRCPGCSCGYLENLRLFLPSLIKDLFYHFFCQLHV